MKHAWLFICVIAIFLCGSDALAQNRRLEILRDARVRSEPGDLNAQVVAYVPTGTRVPLLEQRGAWYKIEYRGVQGWVYNELTRMLPERSAAEMFTQQDVSVLPPAVEPEEEEERIKYARAARSSVNINSHIDPRQEGARILATTRGRDDIFVLIHEGTSWCCVYVERVDTLGWVRCADIEILDAMPTRSAIIYEAKNMFLWVGIGGAAVLIVVLIVTVRHVSAEKRRNVYVQKNVLIIAKEPKMVTYTLTNTTSPIEKCFSELGFNVSLVKDSIVARNSIEHNMPDLILVDWNFETAIFSKIENLFSRLSEEVTAKTYVLFFNVPDLSAAPKNSKALPNVSFIGITVSDRDIFNVVTPLLTHSDNSGQNVQKSVQHCALEGEIDGGNLLEVLQFIEIGSRTGCLMIETKGPFGLIYFGDGRITYAATTGAKGVDAVYDILNQPSGKFRFIANRHPKAANLNLPTLSILMEWTKNKDEARRS